jgi:hypothetical protein
MRLISMPLDELPDEAALANTSLTPHQDNFAPRRLDPRQQVSQQSQFFIPLQKHELKATEGTHNGTYGAV